MFTKPAIENCDCGPRGAQRHPIYEHLDRSFSFGGTESLPIVIGSGEPSEKDTSIVRTLGGNQDEPPQPKPDGVCHTAWQTSDVAPGQAEADKDAVVLTDTIGGQSEEAICTDSMQIAVESCAVHPERREELAEREEEEATSSAEPVTPKLCERCNEPQHITHTTTVLQAERHDISSERDLARAVILRAFEDSQSDPVAQRWFEASQGMLEFWCQVAGLDPGRVRKRARESGEPRTTG